MPTIEPNGRKETKSEQTNYSSFRNLHCTLTENGERNLTNVITLYIEKKTVEIYRVKFILRLFRFYLLICGEPYLEILFFPQFPGSQMRKRSVIAHQVNAGMLELTRRTGRVCVISQREENSPSISPLGKRAMQ